MRTIAETLQSIFNNRELASIIWGLILIVLFSIRREIRQSFGKVVESALNFKIIASLILMLAYGVATVFLLVWIGYWKIAYLKDTLLWFAFSCISTMVNCVTDGKESVSIKKCIVEHLKLLALFEFIVNCYAFPLWGELILTPFLIFLVTLEAVAVLEERKNKAAILIVRLMMLLVGLGIVFYSVYRVLSEPSAFLKVDVLKEFLLAPILTLLFIPAIYAMVLYSRYELLRARLSFFIKNPSDLRKHMVKLIWCCHLSIFKLDAANKLPAYDLAEMHTLNQIRAMIDARCKEIQENVPVD